MLKNFSKTVFIYGLAPAFSKGIGFLLLPFYTRVFSPEEFGVIDLFNTTIHLIAVLIDLQIYNAVGRYFNKAKDKMLLVSTGMWNEVILCTLIVFIFIIFSSNVNLLLTGKSEYNSIFILALLWIPCSVLSTFFSVVMRFENKPSLFLKISVIQTVIKITITLSAILIFRYGISAIYIGYIVGDTTALFLLIYFLRKYVGLKIDFIILKKLLIFSLPLVPATLALYMSNFLNRIIMLNYLSLSSLGIFAVGLKVASVFSLLHMALRMAWEPFIYSNLNQDDHKSQFINIYKAIALLLCFLISTITLYSKEILYIVTTKEYFTAMNLVGILSINFAFKILFELIGIGPKIIHKTIYFSISRILGMTIGCLSMLFLIPIQGVTGAALAVCLGSAVTFLLGWYYTEKHYPLGYPRIFTFMIVFIMFLVVILNSSIFIHLKIKIAVTVLFLVIFLWNRENIIRLINKPPV